MSVLLFREYQRLCIVIGENSMQGEREINKCYFLIVRNHKHIMSTIGFIKY